MLTLQMKSQRAFGIGRISTVTALVSRNQYVFSLMNFDSGRVIGGEATMPAFERVTFLGRCRLSRECSLNKLLKSEANDQIKSYNGKATLLSGYTVFPDFNTSPLFLLTLSLPPAFPRG